MPDERSARGDSYRESVILIDGAPSLTEARSQRFYAIWQRQPAIVRVSARRASFPRSAQGASIKWVRGGRERYRIDGRSAAIDETCFLIVHDAEVSSEVHESAPVEIYSVFFSDEQLREQATALRGRDAIEPAPASALHLTPQLRPHDAQIAPLLRRIETQMRTAAPDALAVGELSHLLLAALTRAEQDTRERIARLPARGARTRHEIFRRGNRMRELIHAAYDRRLGIEDLAAAAQTSPYYALRLFRALTGRTPHRYLTELRIAHAQRLLAVPHLSTTDVALAVGFPDRSTFYRAFRAVTGDSPTRFRDQLRQRKNCITA